MSFTCDPERADALKPLLYKGVYDIVENGPKQEELDKVIKNIDKLESRTKIYRKEDFKNFYKENYQ